MYATTTLPCSSIGNAQGETASKVFAALPVRASSTATLTNNVPDVLTHRLPTACPTAAKLACRAYETLGSSGSHALEVRGAINAPIMISGQGNFMDANAEVKRRRSRPP